MKKLTDVTKQEILKLYRETNETTSTLSVRYDVSNSTISRFLKVTLDPAEYDQLIQNKKRNHRHTEVISQDLQEILADSPPPVVLEPDYNPELDLEPEAIDNLDEFYDEEDLDEEESDQFSLIAPSLNGKLNLEVLPIADASFPKTCYLVIDRSSELITRPLKDFAQLGKIPSEEFQQKTLPIFDNHKVAKRFSNRSQKVIKVPDSSVFNKTSDYLRDKGITRVLIDGQIYSLT
jgi:hypothetical protein